jgi:hypothetical protein
MCCQFELFLILVILQCNFIFLDRFSKNIQKPNIIKIHMVGAELFHQNRQTERQTDMTKLMVVFRNFCECTSKYKVDFV